MGLSTALFGENMVLISRIMSGILHMWSRGQWMISQCQTSFSSEAGPVLECLKELLPTNQHIYIPLGVWLHATFMLCKQTRALPIQRVEWVRRETILAYSWWKAYGPQKRSCVFLAVPFSCWYESHVRFLSAGVREPISHPGIVVVLCYFFRKPHKFYIK